MYKLSMVLLLLLLASFASAHNDINYGLNHYKMGLYKQAIPALLSSVPELEKQDPSDPRVTEGYLALGVIAHADNLYDKAEEFMKSALRLAPHTTQHKNIHIRNAHNTLGNFYIKQSKYKLAIPHLEKALSISTKENDDHVLTAIDLDNLALVYSKLGDNKRAIKLAKEALALVEKSPNHKHYLRTKGIVLYNTGKSYERMGDKASAIKSYDSSISNFKELIKNQPAEAWRIEIVRKAREKLSD